MGVFNTLYEKGYCKKEAGEPQEGDGEDTISGTGLGDGKGGEKDISKDIDDKEDLIGTKEVCLILAFFEFPFDFSFLY